MDKIGDVAKATWLQGYYLLFNASFFFEGVDDLGHVIAVGIEFALREELVIEERTAKMSQVTLYLLQVH